MGKEGAEARQKWIDIQLHTFTNWINEQLQGNVIKDLTQDLSDGVNLIRLVEILQGRRYYGKVYDQEPTEIQKLMNVQMALDALREDGVKTVNIGSHDIVDGNEKLILGLIWCLVQRYQIACKTKIPPKKLVMAWIQSALPDLKLTNFRTNWNDGIALSALLEYCQPGLCPEWRSLDPSNSLENCERALHLAERYLEVPKIISSDHLSSPHLDELSCLTYLSYFITKGAPGYRATLKKVSMLLPECNVEDLEHSWSDGFLLAHLVEACGGSVPELERMRFENFNDFVENVALVLDAAADIGVGSLIGADDIADPQGEHLGTMALVAALCSIPLEEAVKYTDCYVNQQVNLDLAFTSGSEVRMEELDVRVFGPDGQLYSNDAIRLRKSRTTQGANLSLIPMEPGIMKVRIYCQGSELPASPISLQVHTQEETRSTSRAASRAHPENRNPTSSTTTVVRTAVSPVRREEHGKVTQISSETEVDISHKSFAARRLHIIKQLEAQHVNHIAQTKSHQQPPPQQQHHQSQPLLYSQSPSIVQVVQPQPPPPTPAQSSSNIPPPPPIPAVLEASAYREMPLTRSPDVGLVSFSGLSEPCSVGSIVEVVINAHGDAVSGSVYVEAVSPTGKVHRCTVRHQDNSYMATFTPQEVGLWRIGILYDGEHIRGSPFACQVFDAGLVNVYGLDVGLVGQELKFSVNTVQAGHGNLNVTVLRHGHEIPLIIEEQEKSKVYQVSFIPDGAGQYKIHVLFNRLEIKGSPFILDIADASSVSVYGENLRSASVGKTASFMVHAVGADSKDISARVTAPSGADFPAKIVTLDDVTFQVEWTPKEPGEHSVDVMLADQRVPDAPFGCNVGAPDLVHVRNMPRRILPSKLDTDHSFEIDASAAGSGNLEIMINGGRVPCRVREIGSRQYMAIFTPSQSITHTIEMRFNGEHVSGSPWKLPVEDRGERRQEMERTMSYYSELSGPGLVRAPVNRIAQFDISGEGLELSDIQAKISGPDNKEFPIRIIPRTAGKYTAEYQIEQVGEHHLTVWIAGRKVDGSPLSVAGYATEKVRLEPLGGGAPNQPVQFYVDAVEAGKGQLEISVNQGRVPNNVQMQGAGRCLVTFIPQHAGTYVIDVTFNGEQVHGCPIKVEILPKQVGQQIHANLTPTAVSTAISAGGHSSISGAFRDTARSPLSARSPTSPTLLQHARQRSEETMLRSPQLIRESRNADKPWQSSYAPTSSSRNAFSQSPHRDWSASTVYDRVYGSSSDVERTLSPSDPSRNRNIRETTTVIHRTPSPTGLRSHQITETITRTTHRSPSPPRGASNASFGSVRTQEFAERIARSPSPTGYEREFVEKRTTYRSPSPARTSSVAHSHISEVPLSPIQGLDTPFDTAERVKKVERMDPLADEEERERRRIQFEKDSKNTLGYTVAQYGDSRSTPERRYFGDTLEKKDRPPSAGYYSSVQRSTSPEYSTVYERYERKPDLPPKVEGHVSASYKGYEPVYSEVTTTRTTTTTEYENVDRRPNVPKRAATPEGHVEPVSDHDERDKQTFLRTQSEKVFEPVETNLRRSDEKESIYDLPPQEKLERYPEAPRVALSERDQASAIADYAKGKEEDIYEASRNVVIPPAPKIAYDEKEEKKQRDYYGIGKLDDKQNHYGSAGECPPGPKIAYSDSTEAVVRDKYTTVKEDHYGVVGQCPPAPEVLLKTEEVEQVKADYSRVKDNDEKSKSCPPPPAIEVSEVEQARRTEEYLRVKSEDDKILAKHGFTRKPEPSIEIQEPVTEQIRDDVVEAAVAPEVALRPSNELPHSPAPSSKSTPATTPKLSAKFKKDGKEAKPFDFGKSKFNCKHDVIKRGKEVEVKLEGVKLGKEDQLRVVVLPPANKSMPGANGGPPTEVETKVKKSSSKYEITFKPTEVGTHKVFAYVNEIQHPLSPFAVRVYDASEIIVGEIPQQSHLNDTVEFTVDAGRAGFGNLEMAIKDADGVIIPSHVAQLESGSAKFLVTFTPATKGPHTVNITFNKEVLKNSPFEVNIIDAPLPPVVYETAAVASPSLSKKELKEQEKEKKREEKERAKREKEERATLKKEKKSKTHRFPAKTTVSKIPSLSRVGQPSSLVVEVSGHDQLEIRVLDSKKNEIGTDIVEIEPGHMQINFTPSTVGDHEIDVRYGGVPVTGSPFTCRAYDPAKIKVGNIPKGLLDKQVYFTVDASEAGVGNLEVAVCDGRVPSMAHALGHHKYDISFVPKEDVDHTITVRFNNEPVPGSPFLCQLVATAHATAAGAGLERIPVDEETEIQITTDDTDTTPEARVRDPQGNDLPVNVTRSRDSETLHIATYVPKCVGNHLIDISLAGEPIAGSPFTAKAYDARKTVLVPPTNAVVGNSATFVIDAARSGAGNMEIIVSVDNRNVPNFVQAEGQARFKVSFTPTEAKDHIISVKFNGISVPGSPMICEVAPAGGAVPAAVIIPAAAAVGAGAIAQHVRHTPQHSTEAVPVKQTTTTVLQKTPEIKEKVEKTGLARELNSAQVGQKKGFTIDNINKSSDCNVIITDPKGGPLPVRCYKQQDDSYWVEFTPEHLGTHTIEVTFGDVPVPGSPFKTEVIDPKNVEVRGLSEQILLRHATTINVDRRNAGSGELQVEVTDPTGSPLKVEMLKSPGGEDRITFLPSQTGPHKVNVKVSGFQIPGYPQTILVSEQEKPAVYGAAVDQSIKIGEPASLIFDPKKNNGGLKILVNGPSGEKVHYNVMRRPNGTSEVVFYPEDTGAYKVNIDHNNRPISGSPFVVNVVDPAKVIVNDLDMDRDGTLLLRLGHSNSFDVDATAAGPGKLRAEVRDADSSLIGNGPVVEDMGQGKYRVRFNPDQPGKYSIYLYWNELPVESAFPVRARSSAEDLPTTSRAVREPIPPPTTTTYHTREKSSGSNTDDEINRIMVRGDGLHRAVLKEHNEFIIDGSDINKEGRITATLLGSKADIPVRIQQLGHNVYKATYTPLTGGTYELHILWNGKHVKGSPFAVSADTSAHLADLIDVDASTLKIGIINENIKTVIDTRRAGSGQLSALCMGPVKPAYCELYDHRDGTYALCVRPAEIGKHTLVIKYDDEHVKGSPFVVHVSLPPDPSKVRVYGPGVEHGILSLFKSNFVVETRGAGAGQLTVRVRGPKGAFNVEMQREKKNERTIHCKYEPKEPGDYQVEVKWHGEHVPGSPFLVMIVDTEKELSRFLRGEAPSPTPATPFIPPGWVAPPPPMFQMPPGQRFMPQGHGYGMAVPSPYGSVPPPTKHKGRNH